MNDSGALPPSVKLPTLPARDARAQWTDEEVAYALGLVMQGYTYARAAAVMKEEWGYAPNRHTIQRWATGSSEVMQARQQAIVDAEIQIAHAASDHLIRSLDSLYDRPDSDLVKLMVPLNIVQGTAVDKLIRMAPPRPTPTYPIVIILDPGLPAHHASTAEEPQP